MGELFDALKAAAEQDSQRPREIPQRRPNWEEAARARERARARREKLLVERELGIHESLTDLGAYFRRRRQLDTEIKRVHGITEIETERGYIDTFAGNVPGVTASLERNGYVLKEVKKITRLFTGAKITPIFAGISGGQIKVTQFSDLKDIHDSYGIKIPSPNDPHAMEEARRYIYEGLFQIGRRFR